MTVNKEFLKKEALLAGVELNEEMLERFDCFASLLIETNKQFNLTAITEPDDIVVKHFADSISLLGAVNVPKGAKLIDVGTGGGFPGIPLLIARPDLDITMMDSTGKKLNFVSGAVTQLGLKASIVHARAEEAGRGELRESFDFAVSRAVAALNVLAEYCLPFVKVGGMFIPMKGAKAAEEMGLARTAVKTLGGKYINEVNPRLSDGAERSIIIFEKVSATPPKYPRPSAQISKRPL